MSTERDPLDEFLESISDDAPVDWDAAVRGASGDARARVEALRDVSRIANFNRDLQRSPAPPLGGTAGGAPMPEAWGDLLLLERLGSGSQAEVYRAWDPKLRREVALKLLLPDARGAGSATHDSPLIDEGRAAARIRHPHVVAIHGIDRHAERVGLWMELVRGTSLEQEVRGRGPLSPAEATRLGAEIGSALAAVHAAGLLHRDVKPANIVRDAEGRYVLTDFGLGAPTRDATSLAAWPSGTPMYMAPELLLGAAPSERSEVYALGMLMWFALAGRHPFDATTLAALREAAARGPQPRLSTLRPELPAPLTGVIERAIAAVPEKRFATAQQMVEALRSAIAPAATAAAPIDGATTATAAETPRPAAPRGRVRMLALVGLAAVAAVIAVVTTRGRIAPGHDDARPTQGAPTADLASQATSDGAAGASYSVEASFLRRDDGTSKRLITGDRVAPGDRLSMEVRTSRPAWVYVLNEDEHGERYLLFPQPSFDLQNPLPAERTLLLPGTIRGSENAWTVTSAGGHEHFLVVVSPEPVSELEDDLDRLPAPQPGRPVAYAAVTARAVERLRGTGGLSEVPPTPTANADAAGAFDRVRALAGRESDVRGIWIRQVVLENPDR